MLRVLSTTTHEAPTMPSAQTLQALQVANQTRFARAALKRRLANVSTDQGMEAVACMLEHLGDFPELHNWPVRKLLDAIFQIGDVRVRSLLAATNLYMAHDKTCAAMTDRQRLVLITTLRAHANLSAEHRVLARAA